MDFTRPLIREESVVSQSKVAYVPVEDDVDRDASSALPSPSTDPGESQKPSEEEDRDVDRQLIRIANRAAADLFGVDDERTVDASEFPDWLLPQHSKIQAGDLVVLQVAFDQLDFVYATPGDVYHNRNGKFPHDHFIGLPYGSKVRSSDRRGYGFLHLLKPTPELWVRSLNHRTQIIHELDSSQIVFQLHLRPNMTVVETGTGSTALSHAIARTIAPRGMLHTIEFNGARATAARAEFERNGLSHLVTVHHLDSCTDGFVGIPDRSVDAVSLDLPEPWRAVPHAARTCKLDARIASYSPCVEQTQRTVAALQEYGFHTIVTMEYRLQEHYVDQVEYEPPPTAKRPKLIRDRKDLAGREDGNDDEVVESDSAVPTNAAGQSGERIDPAPAPVPAPAAATTDTESRGRRRMVVARPFPTMRGHTAFLTFATLGVKPRRSENGKKSG